MSENHVQEAVRALSWRIAPQFPEGEGAKTLLETYQARSHDNEFLNRFIYDEKTKTVKGSSALMNSRLDSMLQPLEVKVSTTTDVYTNPQIQAMLQGKFYTDDPALVLRGHENKGYERNTSFIKQLIELVEEANDKVEFPLLIRGFDFQPMPEDTQGYGLRIVKRSDFLALPDKSFRGENNGRRFTEVTGHGSPKFDKNGKFVFYADDNATLARLYVYSGLA